MDHGSVKLVTRAFPQGQEKYHHSSVSFLDRTSAPQGVVRKDCQALDVWAGSFGEGQIHTAPWLSLLSGTCSPIGCW